MKGPHELAGCAEVFIKRLRERDRFIEEDIRETIGLRCDQRLVLSRDSDASLTNCCAAAARLQNAFVTSSAVHVRIATLLKMDVAVLSVMSNSFSENHPDSFGNGVTSSCDAGGRRCSGMRYSSGIFPTSSARFAAAIVSHLSTILM